MVRKSIGVMLALLMLGLLLACAQPAEVSPMIVLAPASGEAKIPIVILGAGFQPGEEVKIILTAGGVGSTLGLDSRKYPEGKMPPPVADEYGAFMFRSAIPRPEYCPPGVHIVRAVGNKGSVATFPLGVLEAK